MLKKRASNARFAGVCSGVLFAVNGAFAVSLAEEANAQTAMQVYEPVGTFQAEISSEGVNSYDGNLSVQDLLVSFNFGFAGALFIRMNSGDGADGRQGSTALRDGLPLFGADVLTAGDRVRFVDTGIRGVSGGANVDITVRIYKQDDGDDLYMAAGESPATMAATVTRPQFFLDTNWKIIPTAAECGAMTPPQVLDSDTNMCRPPTDAECMAKTTPQRLNTAGDMCEDIPPNCGAGAELNAAMNACICTDSTHTLDDGGLSCSPPATTPPTCAENNTAANCTCPDGETRQTENSVFICAADSDNSGMTATVNSPISDGGGSSAKKGFVFGVIGLFFAVHFLQGDAENFSYSPSFGYSFTESGYSANVGGRMNFRKDEWRLFWTAGQANANGEFGEFRYASGGEYKTDFWKASFSESVQGETANYDFSLSADLTGGIWSLSPTYRMHSRFSDGETETRNSLNLEGVLEWNRWQIRQSAGFQWRRAEGFADNARFRLEAVREF